MTSRFFFPTVFLILFVCAVCCQATAKIYIDIDEPGFRQFPIAVCDFQNTHGLTTSGDTVNTKIAEDVRFYLSLTGLFELLDKSSFLEGVEPGLPEVIRFTDWSLIGADFLLRGDVARESGRLTAEIRLYDIARGRVILQKKYKEATSDTRETARAIASDILLTITGDEGDFSTKIALVVKNKGAGDIFSINYDATELAPITTHKSIIITPRWSPDGRFLAFTSYKNGRPVVYLRNLHTGKEKEVAAFPGLNMCGSFSPDSRNLLLTLSKDGNEEIYSLNVETMKLTRLTNNYAIDVSPAWSPDGEKIVFVSNRSGTPQIFIMDAGGQNVNRVTFKGNYNTSPSWSPRGDRIAYEGLIDRKYQIFTVDTEGNNPTQLTFDEADNEYPSWSPSGRQIVYSSRRGSKTRICIMNANGQNMRILLGYQNGLAMPSWSPRMSR